MSLLKQRGRELERFDGLSLIYWYVNATQRYATQLEGGKKSARKFIGMWLKLAHARNSRTQHIIRNDTCLTTRYRVYTTDTIYIR